MDKFNFPLQIFWYLIKIIGNPSNKSRKFFFNGFKEEAVILSNCSCKR